MYSRLANVCFVVPATVQFKWLKQSYVHSQMDLSISFLVLLDWGVFEHVFLSVKRLVLALSKWKLEIWFPFWCKWSQLFLVFTWRHGRFVGAPKQRNGGHVGAPTKSSENLTLLLCKCFLLFSLKNEAVDHVSESQQYDRSPKRQFNSYEVHFDLLNVILAVIYLLS